MVQINIALFISPILPILKNLKCMGGTFKPIYDPPDLKSAIITIVSVQNYIAPHSNFQTARRREVGKYLCQSVSQ